MHFLRYGVTDENQCDQRLLAKPSDEQHCALVWGQMGVKALFWMFGDFHILPTTGL